MQSIIERLDKVASSLEAAGFTKLAAEIDVVSNSVEAGEFAPGALSMQIKNLENEHKQIGGMLETVMMPEHREQLDPAEAQKIIDAYTTHLKALGEELLNARGAHGAQLAQSVPGAGLEIRS